MGKNIDVISSFLLILVILGVGIYASNQSLTGDKTEVYYDFQDLDLLNVTGVEVIENQDYNSLVFSEGFETLNGNQNLLFSTIFGEDLTNVSEYFIEFQYDISNVSESTLNLATSLEFLNSSELSFETIQDSYNSIGVRRINTSETTQLTGNTGLVNGRDELVSGVLKVTLRVNTKDDFIVGTFDFKATEEEENNLYYTNVIRISDEIETMVENAEMNFGFGLGITEKNLIATNNTFSIDYIKLSFNE